MNDTRRAINYLNFKSHNTKDLDLIKSIRLILCDYSYNLQTNIDLTKDYLELLHILKNNNIINFKNELDKHDLKFYNAIDENIYLKRIANYYYLLRDYILNRYLYYQDNFSYNDTFIRTLYSELKFYIDILEKEGV